VLAQAISRLIANKTDQWISLDAKRAEEPVYDRNSISKYLEMIHRDSDRWRFFRGELDKPVVGVTYEDLMEDPQKWVDEIAHTFGVSGSTSIGPLPVNKQGNDRNSQWAERYSRGH